MGSWSIRGTTTSTRSLQGPTNPLNNTRHQQCRSSGHTRDHTLAPEPASTHKPQKSYQTLTSWVLGPYEGPHPQRKANKRPQTALTPPDTYTVGPQAIRGSQCHHGAQQPLNHTKHQYNIFMLAFLPFLSFYGFTGGADANQHRTKMHCH